MFLSKGQLSNFSYTYVWTEKIRKIDLACFYTRHVGMVVISVTIWLSPVLKGRKSVCIFIIYSMAWSKIYLNVSFLFVSEWYK